MLKNIWNLCNDSDDSIWSTWIKSNLLRDRNFLKIKAPKNCSWGWGKILKLGSLAWPKMKYTIGNVRKLLYGLTSGILTAPSWILTVRDSSMIQEYERTRWSMCWFVTQNGEFIPLKLLAGTHYKFYSFQF